MMDDRDGWQEREPGNFMLLAQLEENDDDDGYVVI